MVLKVYPDCFQCCRDRIGRTQLHFRSARCEFPTRKSVRLSQNPGVLHRVAIVMSIKKKGPSQHSKLQSGDIRLTFFESWYIIPDVSWVSRIVYRHIDGVPESQNKKTGPIVWISWYH